MPVDAPSAFPLAPALPAAGGATAQDASAYFFREGTHATLYDVLGCHLRTGDGADFAVWAPNAASVAVIGDWNGWAPDADPLQLQEGQSHLSWRWVSSGPSSSPPAAPWGDLSSLS